MLISLHLPKTAGSSFLAALVGYYSGTLLRDYADLPINTPRFKRNAHALKMLVINSLKPPKNVECIHGHFLPLKYLLCGGVKFITWVRDPVERLGSHYYYWLRNYNPCNAPTLHKRVIEEQWSLERFCLSPELKNFYCQFLWGFPINRFEFIGITEYFESDLSYFGNKYLGIELLAHEKNKNRHNAGSSYFEDDGLRKKVEQYHSKDVSFYEKAINMRLTRSPCERF